MPQIIHKKSRGRLWLLIGTAILVVVVMAAAGTAFYQRQLAEQKSDHLATMKVAAVHVANRNYDQAISLLREAADNAPTKEYEEEALNHLGTAYLNAAKYEEAIRAFEEMREVAGQDKVGQVTGIAIAAERLGDRAKALEYYRKTLDFHKRNPDPQAQADVPKYERKVAEFSK